MKDGPCIWIAPDGKVHSGPQHTTIADTLYPEYPNPELVLERLGYVHARRLDSGQIQLAECEDLDILTQAQLNALDALSM
jgi:hypothetical protein